MFNFVFGDDAVPASFRQVPYRRQGGVNLLLGQEDVLGRPDLGDDLVVEHDGSIFQRAAGRQIAPSLFDADVVHSVAPNVNHQRQGYGGEGLEHGGRRRIGLGIAGHIVDADGIGLAAIGEADHAPSGEILDEFFVLRSVVRRRQTHRQLHPHDAGDIGAVGLNLVGDPKQGKDKEPVILRLIPAVGDALVGNLIVILQHIHTEGPHLALCQAGDKRLAPHQLSQ